jgi:hypothetical protein
MPWYNEIKKPSIMNSRSDLSIGPASHHCPLIKIPTALAFKILSKPLPEKPQGERDGERNE